MENELAAPSGAPSSGKKASGRVEKWKNNEESYINKTQQQQQQQQQPPDNEHELLLVHQQWRENYYKTIIEKCLPGGWLLRRVTMGSKKKVVCKLYTAGIAGLISIINQ